MDDIVRQAMARWPDVPAVYGWLALDRRGNWLLKGETIANAQINTFMSRNYLPDAAGCWYFQNGPQRVFVALAYTPFVYILPDHPASRALRTHTRLPVREVRDAWLDEQGTLLLFTEHGIGHVHDQDLEGLLPCFTDDAGAALDEDTLEAHFDTLAAGDSAPLWFRHETGAARLQSVHTAEVPAKFGFNPNPKQPQAIP